MPEESLRPFGHACPHGPKPARGRCTEGNRTGVWSVICRMPFVMRSVVIRKSAKTAAGITVVGFLLGIGGALLLRYAGEALVGWLFIITAGFTLVYGFGTLLDRRPQLILSVECITEPFSVREPVEWNAIRYADDFFFRGQYVVRMLLDRDYKPDLIGPSWFWRFDRLYGQQGLKVVYIRTSGLEISAARLVALIRRMTQADAAEREEILKAFAGRRGELKNR